MFHLNKANMSERCVVCLILKFLTNYQNVQKLIREHSRKTQIQEVSKFRESSLGECMFGENALPEQKGRILFG